MRPPVVLRSLLALALAGVLGACGSSPAAPGSEAPSVQIATGPQVLRITFQTACPAFEDARLLPLVYTRVTVTRAGAEWIATALSPSAGDVELRFRETDRALGGFVPVSGTIKGAAIHLPELAPSLPVWEARVSFGSDGRTALSAVAFGATAASPAAGVSGTGAGAVALSDGAGHTCNGTSFSWGLGPA